MAPWVGWLAVARYFLVNFQHITAAEVCTIYVDHRWLTGASHFLLPDTTAPCCSPCRPATNRRWRRWGPAWLPGWARTWRPSCSWCRASPARTAPPPAPTATPPAGETCPCSTSSRASGAETPPTCSPGKGPWTTPRAAPTKHTLLPFTVTATTRMTRWYGRKYYAYLLVIVLAF